jgi:adenine deaminase
VKRAIDSGIDIFKILHCACINPILHYNLDVGRLRPGDPADFIVVNNLQEIKVLVTYINGQVVAAGGITRITRVKNDILNNFNAQEKKVTDFQIKAKQKTIRVIVAEDGQLITGEMICPAKIENGFAVSDIENDILKIAVVNRYAEASPAIAFVKNFALKRGAIASSVAHDSHNIIAVGTDDASIARAVNVIIQAKGGIVAVDGEDEMLIPLPVAGIMSAEDGYSIARDYKAIDAMAKRMGSTLGSPYMTLSFMALLVIPALKLSDKGLFEGNRFDFTDVFVSL